MKLSVFTATFNRVDTLDRLYQSLKNQTNYDFEWIVIDDGSTDGTSDYFENVLNGEKLFHIHYTKTSNCGKHRAINIGLDIAVGEYFFIVDSDDYLTRDSVDLVYKWINSISETNQKFVGVSGVKGYSEMHMVGKTFNGEFLDCYSYDTHKYNILGDKSEVFKLDILRRYKFPEIKGENFITEAIVWNRIANDGFLIRYFNKINYICEYREDGLTSKGDLLFSNNLEGYTLYVAEILKYKISLKVKMRAIMAYGYRGRLIKKPYKVLANNINVPTLLLVTSSILGFLYKKVNQYIRRGG